MANSAFATVPLRLRRGQDRRLRIGHPWIYSNEVDTDATPLRELEPGQAVLIERHDGRTIGTGYVNPHSLICARILSRDARQPYGPDLLRTRLQQALQWRERLFDAPWYRMVFGEGDGLPGLVIDRFDRHCVVQITTAGMECCRDLILDTLKQTFNPAGILLRNDAPVREREDLDSSVIVVHGDVPHRLLVRENGLDFLCDPYEGQKTGWFYDHRDNRHALRRWAKGRTVLDVFSYLGGWALNAAAAGAQRVVGLDSSAMAIELAAQNAMRNDLEQGIEWLHGNAFELLRQLREDGQRFDLVVLDPPALVKKRRDLENGTQAYRRLNELALRVLSEHGLLISCSCSQLFQRDALTQCVQRALHHCNRSGALIASGMQGPDHPIHPAIEETAYLDVLTYRVS